MHLLYIVVLNVFSVFVFSYCPETVESGGVGTQICAERT